MGAMRSDFSALDAELEELSPGAVVDALALASSYSGDLSALGQIDAALSELGAGVESTTASGSTPLPPGFDDIDLVMRPSYEQLPPAVHDEARARAPSPDTAAADSGAFVRDAAPDSQEVSTQHDVVMLDEDVFDADAEELVEITPEAAPLGNFGSALIDAPHFQADREANAAFVALFEETTQRSPRPSNRPPANDADAMREAEGEPTRRASVRPGPASERPRSTAERPPPTEQAIRAAAQRFDGGTLQLDDAREGIIPIEAAFGGEDLDSAEFEIPGEPTIPRKVNPKSSAPPPASQPPEKRPSFLGRLFGRKDE